MTTGYTTAEAHNAGLTGKAEALPDQTKVADTIRLDPPSGERRMTVREFCAIPSGQRPTMMDAEALWNMVGERDTMIAALHAEIAELKARIERLDPDDCRHGKPWGDCDECWTEWEKTSRMECPFCRESFSTDSDRCLKAACKLISELKAQNSEMRAALLWAALPLETLHTDNHLGAKWMAPETRKAVAEAVEAIRKAIAL